MGCSTHILPSIQVGLSNHSVISPQYYYLRFTISCKWYRQLTSDILRHDTSRSVWVNCRSSFQKLESCGFSVENHDILSDHIQIREGAFGKVDKQWSWIGRGRCVPYSYLHLSKVCHSWDTPTSWGRFPRIGTPGGPGGRCFLSPSLEYSRMSSTSTNAASPRSRVFIVQKTDELQGKGSAIDNFSPYSLD